MSDIISPLPGIFYRKPSPDAEPFASEGDSVEAGQVIGLVEIMKQFSEVTAPEAGTLASFAVEDGAMVNPGDVIATVDA